MRRRRRGAGRASDPTRRAPLWLGLLFGLIALGSVSVAVVLPAVVAGLGTTAGQGTWLMSVYVLMLAVGTACYGRLADVYGIRRPLVIGVTLMSVGAAVSALGPTLPVVLVGRVIQGGGAAAVPPLVMALVDVLFEGRERGVALGRVTGLSAAVACLGPLVGGGVEAVAGWRWALALPAVGLLAIVPLWRVIPSQGAGARLDVPGAVMVTAAAAGLVLVLQAPSTAWPTERLGGPLLLAAVPAVALRLRLRPDGFLPRRVVSTPAVVSSSLAAAAVTTIWFALLVAVPLVLVGQGWTPWHVGLAMAPAAVSGYLGSTLTAPLLARLGPARCLALGDGGATLAAAAVAGGSSWAGQPWGRAAVVGGLMVAMSMAALSQAALVARVGSAVDPDVRGAAIGVATLVFLLGGAAGSAAFGGLVGIVGAAGSLALLTGVPLVALLAMLRTRDCGGARGSTVRT